MNKLALAVAAVGTWELGWWTRRRHLRVALFEKAQTQALTAGRPLVVIGAPDGGVTAGYGCGDVVVDLHGSKACPKAIAADVTKPLPFADNSSTVFVACVLEYVSDCAAAMSELLRISGGGVTCLSCA